MPSSRRTISIEESNVAGLLGIVVLFIYGLVGACWAGAFLPLHGVDLLIHEAGHIFTSVLGNEVFTVLGGSLLQLALPVAFTVYFILQRQRMSAVATSFWVAQNVFDIAVYMADARAQLLPLVSIGAEGEEIIHDWHYLFNHWGVLAYDLHIARAMSVLGILLLAAMLAAGVHCSLVYAEPAVKEPGAGAMPRVIPADTEPVAHPAYHATAADCAILIKRREK